MRPASCLLAALLALGGCSPPGAPEHNAQGENETIESVEVPQTVTRVAAGTTPMMQRVAVLRLLNKRNGQMRDLTLRPGQAGRVGDVIVRLRACETTAPWEIQRLTGAFVQLDVRNPQGQYERAFSGWLYKETPSLNVIEHPIYDVSPMSCAMTHPGGAEPAPAASSRSRAPSSAAPAAPAAPAEAPVAPPLAPAEPAPAPETEAPPPSAEANSAR